MKICFLLFTILISGCSKESNKPPAKSSSLEKKDSGFEMNTNSAFAANDSLLEDNGNRKNVSYVKYGISKLPMSVTYSGSAVAMAQWDDKLGSNTLFITETAEDSNEDTRSKELFGYHFIKNDEGYKQVWRINDFIRECPVDLTLDYIENSLIITDLDSNGVGESSFLYRLSCKGDVSSDDMKFIMHERENKYALRGTMELLMRGEYYQKGSMTSDPLFDKAPAEFLMFAKDRWKRFNTESIGE